MLCGLCLDDPCVWITKKEEMLDYDEHEHLLVSDYPPHKNVCRKKIYSQMALYINSGPSGRGVQIELYQSALWMDALNVFLLQRSWDSRRKTTVV
jgi:hypothetical protein